MTENLIELDNNLKRTFPKFDWAKRWTLSELLEAAMADLEAHMDSGVIFSPGDWYRLEGSTATCFECLAGAWLAGNCGALDELHPMWARDYPQAFRAMAFALNDLRTGDINDAVHAFRFPDSREFLTPACSARIDELLESDNIDNADVRFGQDTIYPRSAYMRAEFFADLKEVVNMLKEYGL